MRPVTASPEVSKRSTNEVAQTQYDLGRSFDRGGGDADQAAQHFKAAVDADPNFWLAQAALAAQLSWGYDIPFERKFPHISEAIVIAKRALERDDNLCEAHLAVAWHAYVREWDWAKATAHFDKAILCDPANSRPHEWYGLFLLGMGQTNEAIRHLEVAERLNGPELTVNEFFGDVLFAARRYAEAAIKFSKAAEMPGASGEKSRVAWAFLWRGGTVQAIENWLDYYYGAKETWVVDLKRVLREQDRSTFWNKRLEAVIARTKDPLILAEASAMAGRTNEALNLLERAYREHHDFLVMNLRTDPEFDILRGEPRFKALLKHLKLDK